MPAPRYRTLCRRCLRARLTVHTLHPVLLPTCDHGVGGCKQAGQELCGLRKQFEKLPGMQDDHGLLSDTDGWLLRTCVADLLALLALRRSCLRLGQRGRLDLV